MDVVAIGGDLINFPSQSLGCLRNHHPQAIDLELFFFVLRPEGAQVLSFDCWLESIVCIILRCYSAKA